MVVVNCISHVEFISTDREILYEIAHTSKKDTNKLAKIAVFFAWKRMFCMAGPFFCSSGAQIHGKHGCS